MFGLQICQMSCGWESDDSMVGGDPETGLPVTPGRNILVEDDPPFQVEVSESEREELVGDLDRAKQRKRKHNQKRKNNKRRRIREDARKLRNGEVTEEDLRREKNDRRKREQQDQQRAAWKKQMKERLKRREEQKMKTQ